MAQADFTRISSNIAALNTLNSLRSINTKLGMSQLRLATGKRINRAADDPAGLTIALKMNARNEGLKAAMGNIGDAKNMLAVAESGLQQISDILVEMKAKTTSAATDTLGSDERSAIQSQLKSLAKQINDIVGETEWNGSDLLDGTVNKTLQTGAGSSDTTLWALSQNHDSVTLGVATGVATGATMATAGTGFSSFNTTSTRVTGVDTGASFDGLTELNSGTYKFRVADKATSASTGKATQLNTVAGVATFRGSHISSVTSTYQLASGNYKLTVDANSSGATIDYTITDSLGNVVATYDGLDASAATQLVDTNGNSLGIEVTLTSSISVGDEINFEYIAKESVKMELYKVNSSTDEQLQAVDANGVDDTGVDSRQSNFYVTASSNTNTYNTGVGFSPVLKAFANITQGDTSQFDYTAAGDVSVDVSTASIASSYMDDVDSAITLVTDSLNSIGSLVARLDSKEVTTSAAQVNIEAAYNRIMNADMALEQVDASKYMILQQTATAMLAQANMAPQGILSLFR